MLSTSIYQADEGNRNLPCKEATIIVNFFFIIFFIPSCPNILANKNYCLVSINLHILII